MQPDNATPSGAVDYERRIQLKTCTLVIHAGVDPVDMLINADRILRGLPALPREATSPPAPLATGAHDR